MIKKNLKMIITLILIVAMLTLSVFAYRFVQRLYPNAMLALRREFIYIGTEIKLIEYTKKQDPSPYLPFFHTNLRSKITR